MKESPVANHTRSKVSKQETNRQPETDESSSRNLSEFYDVPASSQDSVDSNLHLMLKLPSSVTSVTKHHEDFVRCAEADVTDAVRDSM